MDVDAMTVGAEMRSGRVLIVPLVGGDESMEERLFVYAHHNGRVAVIAKVSCQTDFCANTGEFKNFGNHVAMLIAGTDPAEVDDLVEDVIGDRLDAIRETLGEDIQIIDWVRLKV